MKKAIYFTVLNYQQSNLDLLSENYDVTILNDPSDLTDGELSIVNVLFAPLGYEFGEKLMKRAPNLEVIATNTTGVPHIDTKAALKRGIEVISLKDETEFLNSITPTAELTIGLMIAIVRNMVPAHKYVIEGNWGRWDFGGVGMLSNMSLGIVGLGRLGRMVANVANAFGMRVIYYDPYIHHDINSELTNVSSLVELVSQSDIVTVHIPMTDNNRHIFNKSIFDKFKNGSFFVNTARGELVDSNALISALDKGAIKGAALDVLDGEFDPEFTKMVSSHPLVNYAANHNNIIITPHIAGSTYDAWYLTQRHTIIKAINATS